MSACRFCQRVIAAAEAVVAESIAFPPTPGAAAKVLQQLRDAVRTECRCGSRDTGRAHTAHQVVA